MAYDIVAEPDSEQDDMIASGDKALVSWVVGQIQPWRDYRDTEFLDKWDEYYRLWRGVWTTEDKSRDSERSKLISPALQQAIEAAVAELEEAIFGKGKWFDVEDDVRDQNPEDILALRDLLMEDLDASGVPVAVSEVLLNSALYGTGIGKIVIEESEEMKLGQDALTGDAASYEMSKVACKLVAVDPREFCIDTAARTINEAMGCAQDMVLPKHSVVSKQRMGIYREGDLGTVDETEIHKRTDETSSADIAGKVMVTEYHGLVPEALLNAVDDDEFETADEYDIEDDAFVEAIITIANDGTLLRAIRNPFVMKDRGFVSFQYDTVPNRFWGRGIAEKGYNPQKALDAELRGRMDAMALTIHPMMGVDATRLPRGASLSVRPGKTILTNGDPATILRPMNFGQVSPATFTQSGELERMIQMGTGAMDSATPTGISPRNSTASGMSMIASGAIKRSKRTLANIERNFTVPMLQKFLWRYMQFDSERYPVMDMKFKAMSTLGLMAREVEQQQLTNLLQTARPGGPEYWMLIRSIYENSSISDKDKMIQVANQQLEASINPPPPQPSPADQIKAKELELKAMEIQARTQAEQLRAQADMMRAMIESNKMNADIAQKEAAAILSLAKAESEKVGNNLDAYRTQLDAIVTAKSEVRNDNQARLAAGTGQPTGPQAAPGMGQIPGGGPGLPETAGGERMGGGGY